MPDISMCCNITCSRNKGCYRFTAKASFRQSYSDFKPVVDNGQRFECEFFVDNLTGERNFEAKSLVQNSKNTM